MGIFRKIKDLNLAKKGFKKIGITFSFSGYIRKEQLESGFH